MRILIVEDEEKIARTVGRALEANGFVAEYAGDGEDAWFKGSTEPYTAAILDIGLPRLDGLSVLRKWRREGVAIPVILLTAKGSWPERVDGIDAGADDYMVKPFQMEELIARLWGLIRRSSGQPAPVIERGELALDPRQMRVTESGVPISLTPLEFRLLSYLLHNQDKVVSQEELVSNIYFQDQEPSSNAIEVMIARLRRKFATPIIETRRGFGYCIGSCSA